MKKAKLKDVKNSSKFLRAFLHPELNDILNNGSNDVLTTDQDLYAIYEEILNGFMEQSNISDCVSDEDRAIEADEDQDVNKHIYFQNIKSGEKTEVNAIRSILEELMGQPTDIDCISNEGNITETD